jgi:hypothetical protein
MTTVGLDSVSGLGTPASLRGWRWVAGIVVAILGLFWVVTAFFKSKTSAARIQQQLSQALTAVTDSAYRITIGDTRSSLFGRWFLATDVILTPDSAVLVRQRKAGRPEKTRYALRVPSVRLDGIDLGAMIGGRFEARSLVIDGPEIVASLDRRGPQDQSRAMLPHHWLVRLPRAVKIDTVRIDRGLVRYSERAFDGARPGRIQFDQLSVTVLNLVGNPGNLASVGPATIELSARIAESAPFRFTAQYDLRSVPLTMSYQGSVGKLDARRLNRLLVDLSGLKIREGILDSAWFKVKVEDDVATGTVQVLYHDLEGEITDKVTHKRGLKKKIKTFIANHFVLRTDNGKGDDPPVKVGVRLERPATMSFFDFGWKTLRQGLLKTLGVHEPR